MLSNTTATDPPPLASVPGKATLSKEALYSSGLLRNDRTLNAFVFLPHLKTWITTVLQPYISTMEARCEALRISPADFVARLWRGYTFVVRLLVKVLEGVDNAMPLTGIKASRELAHAAFKEIVFMGSNAVFATRIAAVLAEDRAHPPADLSFLGATKDLLLELGGCQFSADGASMPDVNPLDLYQRFMEIPLIACTREYAREVRRTCATPSVDVPTYLRFVAELCAREQLRGAQCAHETTLSPLMAQLHAELLEATAADMIDQPASGLVAMLRVGDTAALTLLHALYSPYPAALQLLVAGFEAHLVTCIGSGVLAPLQQQPRFAADACVAALLEVHHVAVVRITDCFGGRDVFRQRLKVVFERCLVAVDEAVERPGGAGGGGAAASRQVPPAEYLALYIDCVLRKDPAALLDASTGGINSCNSDNGAVAGATVSPGARIGDFVKLVSYLRERDRFQTFFHRLLARRVLGGRFDLDAEQFVITRLKDAFGVAFMQHSERILTDHRLSKDFNREYQDYQVAHAREASPHFINVVGLSSWPRTPGDNVALRPPPELETIVRSFTQFYKMKKQSAKLEFNYGAGAVALAVRFAKGVWEISMPTLQAMICLLFNGDVVAATESEDGDTRWTLEEMAQALGATPDDIKFDVGVLISERHPVLRRHRAAGAADSFTFNSSEFACKSRRLELPAPRRTITRAEAEEIDSVLEKSRGYQVQAACVRVMKARKTLSFTNLIKEAIEMVCCCCYCICAVVCCAVIDRLTVHVNAVLAVVYARCTNDQAGNLEPH